MALWLWSLEAVCGHSLVRHGGGISEGRTQGGGRKKLHQKKTREKIDPELSGAVLKISGSKTLVFLWFVEVLEGLESSGRLVGSISTYSRTCKSPWSRVWLKKLLKMRNLDPEIFNFYRFFLIVFPFVFFDFPRQSLRQSSAWPIFTVFLFECWGVRCSWYFSLFVVGFPSYS